MLNVFFSLNIPLFICPVRFLRFYIFFFKEVLGFSGMQDHLAAKIFLDESVDWFSLRFVKDHHPWGGHKNPLIKPSEARPTTTQYPDVKHPGIPADDDAQIKQER